jgi:hypothetical protein
MNKLVLLILLSFVGTAAAQQGSDAPAGQSPAAPAAPPTAAPAAQPTAAPAATRFEEQRKICVDALNANPEFAKSVVETFNKKAVQSIDEQTIAAHKAAAAQIAENERHVIYAYAAMWILAAGFVVFLWRRQQALQAELASLRRELEAAAKEGK